MDTKKILPVLLLLIGEALIIICFLYFGRFLPSKHLALDIAVTSIIYALLLIDIFSPKVDFKDKSHKTIGALGIRWFFSFFYIMLAIGAMVYFNRITLIDINSQILIHGVLLFLLLFGFYLAKSAADKVGEIFVEEKQIRSCMVDINQATKEVQSKLNKIKDVDADIVSRINNLQENLRFISPCNNQEALELETNFLNEIKAVKDCLFDIPLNNDKIIENIQKCERTYKERKQIFSN